MLLHTILSLKRPLYLQKQGDKEMFEITYSDSEIFEDYQNAGKAHKGNVTKLRKAGSRRNAGPSFL